MRDDEAPEIDPESDASSDETPFVATLGEVLRVLYDVAGDALAY